MKFVLEEALTHRKGRVVQELASRNPRLLHVSQMGAVTAGLFALAMKKFLMIIPALQETAVLQKLQQE